MIIGAHVMVQSKDDKADKAFFSKVLKLPFVDAGNGRLIFAAPSADIMVHESDENSMHRLFLMCADMDAFAAEMKRQGISHTRPTNRGWGTMTELTLPGGGALHVYQPHHKRPKAGKPTGKVTKRKSQKRTKNRTKKKKK